MAEHITVELGGRSYPIHIGARLLAEAAKYMQPLLKEPRVIIITDENVARYHLHRFTGALEEAKINSRAIVLPPGEGTKDFSHFQTLIEDILAQKPNRDTVIVALGGGVVGDIAGFAASVVLRGLPYVQIPTTLLAQVDSSVGGKTAINSTHGKNLIGTFYQPKTVLIDTATLATLPEREMRAGYSEMLKYGLITHTHFFHWLQENHTRVLGGEQEAVSYAVSVSCNAKAEIVAQDEHEAGRRALLNFGHTFGHALEAETGYGDELLHGEAVAIGMMMATQLSAAMELCPEEDVTILKNHYRDAGLMDSPRDVRKSWDTKLLMNHFTFDKKVRDGKLTFILTKGIGHAFITQDVPIHLLERFLEETCA